MTKAVNKKLTKMQKAFVDYYLSDITANATEAAQKAGYKASTQTAATLLKNHSIQKEIKKRQKKREKEVELNAEAVLHFLKTGLFLNPFKWLIAGNDGNFYINDPESLPDEVAQLIEGFEAIEERDQKGNVKQIRYKVKLVSKTTLLQLAMKHLNLDGVQKHQVVHSINWDSLYARKEIDDDIDPIEAELKLIESKAIDN